MTERQRRVIKTISLFVVSICFTVHLFSGLIRSNYTYQRYKFRKQVNRIKDILLNNANFRRTESYNSRTEANKVNAYLDCFNRLDQFCYRRLINSLLPQFHYSNSYVSNMRRMRTFKEITNKNIDSVFIKLCNKFGLVLNFDFLTDHSDMSQRLVLCGTQFERVLQQICK